MTEVLGSILRPKKQISPRRNGDTEEYREIARDREIG